MKGGGGGGGGGGYEAERSLGLQLFFDESIIRARQLTVQIYAPQIPWQRINASKAEQVMLCYVRTHESWLVLCLPSEPIILHGMLTTGKPAVVKDHCVNSLQTLKIMCNVLKYSTEV